MSFEKTPRRLQELQEKFQELGPKIRDHDTKEAISVLHGMLQEIMRAVSERASGVSEGISLKDVADMYRNAPKMTGKAVSIPLTEGIKAPDFALSDANGNIVRLSEFRGTSVLLVFYPLDWSPGCSQQLDLYQNELDEFEKRKVKVIGISVDSIYSHGAWAAVRNIHFPLLSDFNPKGDVARKYQVYREENGFSERALFFVDKEGTIRYSYLSPFLHHVPDVFELFRKIDAVQKPVTV